MNKDKSERIYQINKEVVSRLIGILMQRKVLPKNDADYILEPMGIEAKPAYPGMAFYNEKGEQIT